MPENRTQRATQPHIATGDHSPGHSSNPLVNYELSGQVRWLDVALQRMVVGVRKTDGHAGVFLGQDVTVDLEAARVHGGEIGDLMPGTDVRVKLRLQRDLGPTMPELLEAHSVTVEPAAA